METDLQRLMRELRTREEDERCEHVRDELKHKPRLIHSDWSFTETLIRAVSEKTFFERVLEKTLVDSLDLLENNWEAVYEWPAGLFLALDAAWSTLKRRNQIWVKTYLTEWARSNPWKDLNPSSPVETCSPARSFITLCHRAGLELDTINRLCREVLESAPKRDESSSTIVEQGNLTGFWLSLGADDSIYNLNAKYNTDLWLDLWNKNRDFRQYALLAYLNNKHTKHPNIKPKQLATCLLALIADLRKPKDAARASAIAFSSDQLASITDLRKPKDPPWPGLDPVPIAAGAPT